MGYYDPPDVNEGTYSMECKGYLPEDTRTVTTNQLADLRRIQEAAQTGLTGTVPKLLTDWVMEILDMPKAIDVECGFEGKVDAQFSGGRTAYTAYWTCPRCGTEGEEDREQGDDHPDL